MRIHFVHFVVCAVLSLFVSSANAVVPNVELRFSESQMPLGTSDSIVHLYGGEYQSFGIDVSGAYRYNDSRDPFSDGAENLAGAFGLSLDFGNLARVDFLTPVSDLEIDWWTITSTMYVDVFDTSGAKVHSFSGVSVDGSTEVVALNNISYFEFHDSNGYVQISNIRFTPIPEPTTFTLVGFGLLMLVVRHKRRISISHHAH